ncbi:MFS transporter [Actinokineospora enzanensis]|uniref:MFS transporter n=1 Tax=Actinokineospora enzanensis TaxID=155975 RepID=UPI00035F8704|nr:MFS transporter [Actinokineospora enzanensis]
MSILSGPGPLRDMSINTLVNTVGTGLWYAGSALFLTRSAGIPATSVGMGLTIAGFVGVLASLPAGALADRRDPGRLRALVQAGQAVTAAAYILVHEFPVFLVVATLDSLLTAASLTVRAALVASLAGPAHRVRFFAELRVVANIGIGAGSLLATTALAADTRPAYLALALTRSVLFLTSAVMHIRLPRLTPPADTPESPARRWADVLGDRPYLSVTTVSAALYAHRVVLLLIVPLWTVNRTAAPPALVSVLLAVNSTMSVLFTIRASRGVDTAPDAARTMRRSGLALATAMLIYSLSGNTPAGFTVVLLLTGTMVCTVGELLHASASAGLAYSLAPSDAMGRYQGLNTFTHGTVEAAAPALLTLLLLEGGPLGWPALAILFTAAALVTPALTRWACATRTN